MILLALVCALLLAQFFPLSDNNPLWQAQQRLSDWTLEHLGTGKLLHSCLAWFLAVLGPTLLTLVFYLLLRRIGWFSVFLLYTSVLYLTLGLQQFNQNITAVSHALDAGNVSLAGELLARWQDTDNVPQSGHAVIGETLKHGVATSHRQVFGVIAALMLFATLGLGPIGAVLYRCSQYVAHRWQNQRQIAAMDDSLAPLISITAWNHINWLPARITALGFAIAGNFEQAADNWRQFQSTAPNQDASDALVIAVATGAMDLPDTLTAANNTSASLQDTSNAPHTLLTRLVWRTVLLWMGLIALVTITSWAS